MFVREEFVGGALRIPAGGWGLFGPHDERGSGATGR